MSLSSSAQRISRIETLWTVVGQAHCPDGAVAEAQRQLLERYGGAVRRYLLAAIRDAEAADDLFQEFAVRFLRGGLRGADPTRGRFRDFLKGVLHHLVADFHKKRQRLRPLAPNRPEPVAPPAPSEEDEALRTAWRDELLARGWIALQAMEDGSGQPYYTVLRLRADQPEATSQEMAARLSQVLGKVLTPVGVRQTLHRAREHFADLLLYEIAQTLSGPTEEMIEAELIELNLLDHCRPALRRRADKEGKVSP